MRPMSDRALLDQVVTSLPASFAGWQFFFGAYYYFTGTGLRSDTRRD